MDALTIVIMIILFILALIFVFSTALLTPYIGKKNLLSVMILGLVVGTVGGVFLISPIVDDLPDFTRTIVEESVEGTDNLELELSTNGNLTETIHNISSIKGVENVSYDGITFITTSGFDTDYQRAAFLEALNNSNNVSSVIDQGNNTYYVKIAENGEPQVVLDKIYSTFSTYNYIHLRYTSMRANATVQANNITGVMKQISNTDAVILNVTGPTEDNIKMISQYLPNQTNVILLSAVLGVIVALSGFFVDSIYNFTTKFRKNRNKQTDRDRIKRKVVPGTPRRRTNNQKVRKRDSIDIFDDSFENSPKQTIGSNRKFEPMTEEASKETKKESKKSKGRFSKLFGRSKDDVETPKRRNIENNESKQTRESKGKPKRKAPKVRPRRKE
ncbi:MAG: hypothetical protein E7Z84_08140 [Methanosphaera stadtmanae]|nr:hypothetical protein [Methanosphaera stadtmanae]